MNGTAPIDLLLPQLQGVRKNGTGWTARCPGHEDRSPSLSVHVGDDGRVLLRCFAGCETERIVGALGLTLRDLFPPRDEVIRSNGHDRPRPDPPRQPRLQEQRKDTPPKRLVGGRRFAIPDASGHVVGVHVRDDFDDGTKSFRWERSNGQSGLGGLSSKDMPLYGIHERRPDQATIVVEGELARDALAPLATELGVSVVATVTGAAAVPGDDALRPIVGNPVLLWSDSDESGEAHMDELHWRLRDLGQSENQIRRIVWVQEQPRAGDDAADFVDRGGTPETLRGLIAAAPLWTADAATDEQSENGESPNTLAFPLDVLPPAVRAYVQAASASLSAPPEMVAVPMLGFAGALLGNRLHLILKHSYREYPTLYLAIVAPPGSAKTPALSLAQWPLDALQSDAEQVYREQKARFEEDLDAWRQAKDPERGAKPTKPRLRDYFSSNLTLEALFDMFDRAPGIAIVRDEILGWVSSMDQYRAGKGSDRQEYLSLWSSKTIKLDRKNADPIYRRFPVACVVGGIQPDLAGGLHHEAQKRDGFVERLLPIVPKVQPMPWTEESIDPGRYADVLAVFRALDKLPLADLTVSECHAVGIGVELSPAARTLFIAWFNENQRLIANADGLAAGFYSKLPAHVARIALILHALWHPVDPRPMVAEERVADAIELGEFFRGHIGRFLALLHATAPTRFAGLSARIVRILRIIHAERQDGWASRSDLLHRLGNVKADELSQALDALLAVRTIERGVLTTATKPVEQWRLVVPVQDSTDSKYSHYSNYSVPEPPTLPNGAENFEFFEYFESPNGNNPAAEPRRGEEVLL